MEKKKKKKKKKTQNAFYAGCNIPPEVICKHTITLLIINKDAVNTVY